LNAARDDIPKKVGRYEILEAIGYGAMGAVYKARDPLIKRIVAIKTIRLDVPPASPQYRAFIDRFYREARISGTLNHPNIITLFDIGETDSKVPFLAMEFVDGEPISELLNRGERFRPEQVIGLVSQMASAIDYAHTKGVIHRDIKPSNIIIYDGEKVKIADFGIAKLADSEVTQGGTLLGTPSYMSPEQAMGESLDGRTDIFSLGVVAFEMLSGQQPFPGNNVTSILYKLVHAEPVRPSNLEVLGLLPDKWHEVFNRVLAKSPGDRYPSGGEFVQALEMCLGSWFGSLSGETVVMASPVADKSKAPAPPAPPPAMADDDRTVTVNAFPGAGERTAPSAKFLPTVPDLPLGPEDEATVIAPTTKTDPGLRPAAPVDEERTVLAENVTMAMFDDTRTEKATAARTRAVEELPPTEAVERPAAARPAEAAAAARPLEKPAAPRWLLPAVGVASVLVLGALALAFLGGGEETEPPVEVIVPPPPTTPAGPEAVAAVTGELSVLTDPEGASIFLNGEARGVTPFQQADLALGSYVIRLEKQGFKSADHAVELTENNPKATLGPISLEKMVVRPTRATFSVESTPAGASVSVDGKPAGATPLPRLQVQPGKRTVRLEKEGFKPWEREVEISAGETKTVSAHLQPVETRPAPPPPRPPEPTVKEGELVTRGAPGVTDPKCVKCDPAPYPEIARRLRQEGLVQVTFLVTETGSVEQITVVESGGEVLDNAVVEAVKNWRYEPATKQGVRVKMQLVYRQRFLRGR
jgi:TonB family protein